MKRPSLQGVGMSFGAAARGSRYFQGGHVLMTGFGDCGKYRFVDYADIWLLTCFLFRVYRSAAGPVSVLPAFRLCGVACVLFAYLSIIAVDFVISCPGIVDAYFAAA